MDFVLHDELQLTVGDFLGYLASGAMILGGVLPYVPQYREIRKTQDSDGFSLYVCLALLISNTLRILFWFYKRFELPLLVQSIVMSIAMFLMIHLCVGVRRNNAIIETRDRVFSGDANSSYTGPTSGEGMARNLYESRNRFGSGQGQVQVQATKSPSRHYISDFDTKYFWAWTDFQSYLDFMLVVWAIGAAVTYLMLPIEWFMEAIGFLAVFTEAMLGAPQFLRNFKNRSTHGMSVCMVIMWTIGDVFKTTYFVLRIAPTQFWVCGLLQVSLDLAILLQVYLYRKNLLPRNSHRGD